MTIINAIRRRVAVTRGLPTPLYLDGRRVKLAAGKETTRSGRAWAPPRGDALAQAARQLYPTMVADTEALASFGNQALDQVNAEVSQIVRDVGRVDIPELTSIMHEINDRMRGFAAVRPERPQDAGDLHQVLRRHPGPVPQRSSSGDRRCVARPGYLTYPHPRPHCAPTGGAVVARRTDLSGHA
ncbi:hypothetical protein ACFFWC_23250 [Plantactinospora siamensis]|uniref:Uncharacterized protein n=1 Tax=Plantactinospora siamensis TaxID=555372 RepID=A0ABV6NUB2_9ACTN